MESLFNQYHMQTIEGQEIGNDFSNLIDSHIDALLEKHNPIEIESILLSSLLVVMAEKRLTKSIKMTQMNRELEKLEKGMNK